MELLDYYLNLVKDRKKTKIEDNFVDNYYLEGYKHILKIRDYSVGYLARLLENYTEGIHLLEIFIEECLSLSKRFDHGCTLLDNNKFTALKFLNGKSILCANEILCLVKNGFASGALSSWRTLFETVTFAKCLAKNDESLAEKYLDYLNVEKVREAETYIKFRPEERKNIQEDLEFWKQKRNKCIDKYGKGFDKHYGWAHEVLNKNNINLYNFFSYNKESDELMHFYKHSNIPIHSGPTGLFYNIGHINGVSGETILCNRSNVGFADPAQLVAHSLLESVISFLLCDPKKEYLKELMLLSLQIKLIAEKFIEAERKLNDTHPQS